MMDIFTAGFTTADIGSWIKDSYRTDRSLGIVRQVDKDTLMMNVYFPKISKNAWLVWRNNGHYKVI